MAKTIKDLLDDISIGDLTQAGEARKKNIAKLKQKLADFSDATKIVVGFLNTIEAAEGLPLTRVDGGAAAPREVVLKEARLKHYPYPTEPTGPLTLIQGSLREIIYRILNNFARPVSWDELREELKKFPTVTDVDNERSYYSGVQRLKEKGFCVSYKGRITTPEILKRFLEEVGAGRAVDIEMPRSRNRWAEAILEFLNSQPNKTATFGQIREYLSGHPEIGSKMDGDRPTYMANTLTQMVVRKGVLEKPKKGYYRIKGANVTGASAPDSIEDAPTIVH